MKDTYPCQPIKGEGTIWKDTYPCQPSQGEG